MIRAALCGAHGTTVSDSSCRARRRTISVCCDTPRSAGGDDRDRTCVSISAWSWFTGGSACAGSLCALWTLAGLAVITGMCRSRGWCRGISNYMTKVLSDKLELRTSLSMSNQEVPQQSQSQRCLPLLLLLPPYIMLTWINLSRAGLQHKSGTL